MSEGLRLVLFRPVHPQFARGVDVDAAHEHNFTGPHPGDRLELDHRQHLARDMWENSVDVFNRDRS
jgi:hypothetical protein